MDNNTLTPDDSDTKAYCFRLRALDTWFFRESRPHDAAGATELGSLFPPPVRTLLGAIRTFLGDNINIDWQAFNGGNSRAHDKPGLDFKAAVGDSEDLGQLSINGVWVCYNNRRLYPVPLYLLHKDQRLIRLEIGDCVQSDLGNVRLPELHRNEAGYQPLEQCWIDDRGMQKLLQAEQLPDYSEILTTSQLLAREARLGIARNNDSRSVEEGMLYQTQHLRMNDTVSIEVDIANIAPALIDENMLTKSRILRLGGEGRMASLDIKKSESQAPCITGLDQPLNQFIIHFISPAYFDGGLFPPGFSKTQQGEQTVWQGVINGLEIIIEAAVIGKVHREGGWDMANHQPRPVKSYIPAGSTWFCRTQEKDLNADVIFKALHNTHIGSEQQWGRGRILIGRWQDDNQQGE